MKLSKKQKESLWVVIDSSIMDARIKVAKLDTSDKSVCCHSILKNIDEILLRTSLDCNQKVIKLIKSL